MTSTADYAEFNDTSQTATDLGAFGEYSYLSDLSIHSDSDIDYFAFSLDSEAPSYYYINLWSDDAVDLDLYLYDSSGNLIDSSDYEGTDESIYLNGLAAGNYFIGVESYEGGTGWYELGLYGAYGDYYEENDTFQTATDLGAFGEYSYLSDLSIHSDSDIDYFAFSLDSEAPSYYYINLWSDDAVDLDLYLYDSSGNLIDSSDYEGTDESIYLNGLAAGNYFIGVESYEGGTGWYELGLYGAYGDLTIETLIDSPSHIYMQKAYDELGHIPVFIDTQGISSSFGEAQADALPISQDAEEFIVSILKRLESEIDVTFDISTSDYVNSAMRIMKHEDDSAYSGYGYSGYSSYYYTSEGPADEPTSVDLLYNDISVNTLYGDDESEYWKHIVVHEIGHSLGLEHPFNFEDGDGYGSEAYPTVDQTIMAYGDSETGSYPTWFQDLDIQALAQIWGEKQSNDSAGQQTIDFTGDGQVDTDDAQLILRHMFGTFPGNSFGDGIAIAGTVSEVQDKLTNYTGSSNSLGESGHLLDVDGDGILNPLSDGLAIASYVATQGDSLSADQYSRLFGLTDQSLAYVNEMLAEISGF